MEFKNFTILDYSLPSILVDVFSYLSRAKVPSEPFLAYCILTSVSLQPAMFHFCSHPEELF